MSPETDTTAKAATRLRATKAAAGFSAEEKAAMKERARELKAEAKRSASAAEGEREVRAKLAEMPAADRAVGERLHELVMATAPTLVPRTWYGMPAYSQGDNVICFFKNAAKFKTRYHTLGFSHHARLDDGRMWPTDFALTELTAAEEQRIVELVRRAVS